MEIAELGTEHREAASALWERCGLTRPWNPPERDFDDAAAGPTSAILGLLDPPSADASPNASSSDPTSTGAPSDDRGLLVATAMVGFDGHRGWMYYVAVDPDRQGEGHGRRIVDGAERWLGDHGARKVQLMVRRTNAAATEFYERLGYEDADTTVLARWLDPQRS